MTSHLSKERIEDYRDRRLPPALLIATDNHLSLCQTCRSQLEKAARLEPVIVSMRERLLRAASTDNHISYELLESYVDDKAGAIDTEIAASHIETCRRCAAELNDLRAFAASMANNSEIESPVENPGFWERFFSALTPLRLAVATVAAMVLVALTASVWLVMRSGDGEQTVVATNPWGARATENLNAPLRPSQESSGRGSGQTLSQSQRPELIQKPIPFALSPGRLTTITIPNIAGAVELTLTTVKASDYRNLSVTLVRSFDGMTREIEASKSSNTDEAVLILRTSELMEGRYSITVKGESVSEAGGNKSMREVASYSILVIKL